MAGRANRQPRGAGEISVVSAKEKITMSFTLTPRRTKGYRGLAMEGFIARWYAQNTAGRDHRKTAELVAGQVPAGGSILEVAPGPGYLAIELARLGSYRVAGLDISRSFVEMATANAKDAGVTATFHHGDAAQMPFPSDSFDFIVCQAASRTSVNPSRRSTRCIAC
jgi:2-polyprenyl-3-methyl-5-hydroxy-6-metoxy-1,4-benzoquinol methylase